MENPELQQLLQNLDYGHIYVVGNPKQTHNLRWFATMIEPMIRPLTLKWVETWDIDHTLIVARRFNVGNIGRYATVQLHLNKYGSSDSYSLLAAVHTFSDCLSDVMDDGRGDVIIRESEYGDRSEPPHGTWGSSSLPTGAGPLFNQFDVSACPQDHTYVESDEMILRDEPFGASCPSYSSVCDAKPSLSERLRSKFSLRKSKSQETILWDNECRDADSLDAIDACQDFRPDVEDSGLVVEELDLEAEEVRELRRIESEYERDVRDIRARIVAFIAKYHQDPQQVLTSLLEGKVLIGTNPGRLLVNGDMKIVLPEYDEMEIKMPAMCRTLYILFMKYRKSGAGIVLKNIDEHRNEMIGIYCLVKPGASQKRVEESVNNLCDPFSDALYQTISRVNRCIRNIITDKELSKQYSIMGTRGGEYGIGLSPDLMVLPRAVTGV